MGGTPLPSQQQQHEQGGDEGWADMDMLRPQHEGTGGRSSPASAIAAATHRERKENENRRKEKDHNKHPLSKSFTVVRGHSARHTWTEDGGIRTKDGGPCGGGVPRNRRREISSLMVRGRSVPQLSSLGNASAEEGNAVLSAHAEAAACAVEPRPCCELHPQVRLRSGRCPRCAALGRTETRSTTTTTTTGREEGPEAPSVEPVAAPPIATTTEAEESDVVSLDERWADALRFISRRLREDDDPSTECVAGRDSASDRLDDGLRRTIERATASVKQFAPGGTDCDNKDDDDEEGGGNVLQNEDALGLNRSSEIVGTDVVTMGGVGECGSSDSSVTFSSSTSTSGPSHSPKCVIRKKDFDQDVRDGHDHDIACHNGLVLEEKGGGERKVSPVQNCSDAEPTGTETKTETETATSEEVEEQAEDEEGHGVSMTAVVCGHTDRGSVDRGSTPPPVTRGHQRSDDAIAGRPSRMPRRSSLRSTSSSTSAASSSSPSPPSPDKTERTENRATPDNNRKKKKSPGPSFFSALVHNSRNSRSKSRPRRKSRSKSRPRSARSKSCGPPEKREGGEKAEEEEEEGHDVSTTAVLGEPSPEDTLVVDDPRRADPPPRGSAAAESHLAVSDRCPSRATSLSSSSSRNDDKDDGHDARGPITHPRYKLGDLAREEDMLVLPGSEKDEKGRGKKARSRRRRRRKGQRGRRKRKDQDGDDEDEDEGSSCSVMDDDEEDDDEDEASSRRREADVSLVIGRLRHLDAAFVRRSDGRWTYALVADGDSAQIRFVVNDRGSTKSFPRSLWREWVRRIRVLTPRRGDRFAPKDGGDNRRRRLGVVGGGRSQRSRSRHRRAQGGGGKGTDARGGRRRRRGDLVSPSPTRRNASGVLNLPPTIAEGNVQNDYGVL